MHDTPVLTRALSHRDDDRGFAEVSLVRERNRLVDALDRAIEEAEKVRR